jgi:hypothetical protein
MARPRPCYSELVKALRAFDEDEMSADERAELEAAVDESAAQFERGEFEDARAFAICLIAKS